MRRKFNQKTGKEEIFITSERDIQQAVRYYIRRQQQLSLTIMSTTGLEMAKYIVKEATTTAGNIRWLLKIALPVMQKEKHIIILDQDGELLTFEPLKKK